MKKVIVIFVLFGLLLSTSSASAQSGGPYELTWTSVDAGGGAMSGGAYGLYSTIGQPDTSSMSSGDYSLQGGFWHSSCAPPGNVNPSIGLTGNDVQLSWLPVNHADSYDIYRDTSPYFVATTVYDSTDSSPWFDPGTAGNPAENYFYLIRAVGCGESGDSRAPVNLISRLVPGN